MSTKSGLRDLIDSLEQPQVRCGIVVVGIIILVRLKLILFAAALPLVAYWHYTSQPSARETEREGDEQDAPDDAPPGGEDQEGFDEDGRSDDFPAQRREEGDPDDEAFWLGPGGTAGSLREDDGDLQQDDAPLDSFLGMGGGRGGLDLDGGMPRSEGRNGRSDFDLGGPGDDEPGGFLDGIFGSGGGGDFDFLGGGLGGGGKKGGKGKGKDGKGKGKDGDKGPREANPKQVFVAGVQEASEDTIRAFFEDNVGEVDRLKVLRHDDGKSKGVCFVTFRTEDEAQQALSLSGSSFEGRNITVRLAHAGNKGEKGEKGGKDGGGRGGDRDRDREPDFGGSDRFGAAFGFGDGDRPPPRPKGKGKGGKRGNDRSDVDDILEEELRNSDGPVRIGDFDFAAKRFLAELRSRDRQEGSARFQEALDMVFKYTNSKERSAVRKWPAYIFTLLQKFDPNLWDELRERDAERRANKGGGRGGPD